MESSQIFSGLAFLGEELEPRPADIIVENGCITAIEERNRAPPLWICPAFFNAHTHLADTIAADCGCSGNLVSLVTPPDGLKHRLLSAATSGELIAGMQASLRGMIRSGTFGCADFREGGKEGVAQLRKAVDGLSFRSVIFGREGGEHVADGLGVSSTRDISGLEQIVRTARDAQKKIAFHAGEQDSADVDEALSYTPDLLIHMTHATRHQLRDCADRGIPIAVCPRSNWTLGVTESARFPPIQEMLDLGCTVFLGTDNAMFVAPDMFSEMSFAATVYRLDPHEIYHSAVSGSQLCGQSFFIEKGGRAAFFTVDPAHSALAFSRDPLTSLVKRVQSDVIRNNVFNLETQ